LLLTGALQRGSVQFAAKGYGFKTVCSHSSLMAATFTPVLNPKNCWHITSVFSRKEVTLNAAVVQWSVYHQAKCRHKENLHQKEHLVCSESLMWTYPRAHW